MLESRDPKALAKLSEPAAREAEETRMRERAITRRELKGATST